LSWLNPCEHSRAKERQSPGTNQYSSVENLPPTTTSKARDAAGQEFGVSGKSVDHATKVLEVLPRARGPNLRCKHDGG